jgi:PAS domain S-box-containing protein
MTSVWSHRPQFSHWALFTAAYVVGCGFAKALAIVPGSSVSFWPPGGLLMATLMLTPARSWPWWILGGALAESFGQLVWFSSGLPIGFLIIAGNALEAMAGAWLVNRVCGRPVRLETLREVLAFVVLGAGLAPVISATVGSATLAWFGIRSQTFATAWPLWWIGDATGILIVAPLTLIVIQNWRGMAQLWAGRWIEVSFAGLTFLGVAALALGGYLPFAYIVMPPLLWAAVRFDFKGAAILLVLLTLITAVFTLSGVGQFAGDAESQKQKQIMLHLFLAVSALSALIVAAISRQHQQALATLRESERELSRLVDMVPSHIWRLTPDGRPIFFNKRAIDYFHLKAGDAEKPDRSPLTATIETIAHPDDAAELAKTLSRCVATGERFSMRYRLRRADGAYRWMSGRAEPVRDESGTIVEWYGLTHDIDDQVRAEEALRQASDQLAHATRSASLAEVSASIAHEVNQPLAAIVANSHACQRWLTTEPPNIERAQKTVERVIRDANAAADIVSRIRALFKQSVDTRNATLFGGVVTEARDLVAEEIVRHRVHVDVDVENDLPTIPLDRVQIQQVLVNIMRNGMEAMDDTAGDRVLAVRARRVGDVVQAEISDSGRGVELPDRIFEPFFTTKAQGMGMGLAICRSIVESHGGRLWMEKNEPRGSTFIFTLPIDAKVAS